MNANVIEYITEKAIFAEGMKSKVLTFLEYLNSRADDHYYPLTKISKITQLDSRSSVELARFFCSNRVSLLEPRYIYIDFDGSVLEITKSDFNRGLKETTIGRGEFITDDSDTIEHFDKRRLKFYFVRRVEVVYEEVSW